MATKKRSNKGGGKPRPRPNPTAAPRQQREPASGGAKPTRAQRMEALADARRRRSRNRKLLVAGALVLTLGVTTAVVVADRRAESQLIDRLEAGGCSYDTRSDGDAGQGRNHVASPVYEVEPPAGGDHLASAAPAGIYTLATLRPDGALVHSLEHGDIVLWHQVDIDSSVRDRLIEIHDRYEGDVLVVPRMGLEVPVAATAWHRRLLCPTPDFAALDEFVAAWRDKGPEDVPD